MKNILLSQRQERDHLLSHPYLSRHTNHDFENLLSSKQIKLITGPRRSGKSTQALLMLRGKNFAYLNFDEMVAGPTCQGSSQHSAVCSSELKNK